MGIKVALAGNPNCGKTTLFNDLTGANQYVGNWPGVTVEKKEGRYGQNKEISIVDLPGIYSLSPYSPEEIVSREFLIKEKPDVVINLVDATNLERNLYLTTQILSLGLPVVIALNMMDLVEKNGDRIDVPKLSAKLGCPIVEISALRGRGTKELMDVAAEAAQKRTPAKPQVAFTDSVARALAEVEGLVANSVEQHLKSWYAIKMLEGEKRTEDELGLPKATMDQIAAIRERLEEEFDDDVESIVTCERYDMIADLVSQTVKASRKGLSTTQKIDRVVTNRILGLPIFIVIMTLVYYVSVSTVGTYVTDWANDGVFGDGWLYTGVSEYEEAVEDFEGYQQEVEAYLAAAEEEGLDVESYEAALEVEEPAEDADAATVAAYDEAQEVKASFMAEAKAAGIEGELEDEETGTTTVVDFADFEQASEMEEPDPADFGFYHVGIPVVLGDWLSSIGAADWIQSLIIDGIVAGVGAVLGFVPQLIVLFLLLSFLEGCGYMARVAFVMDRIFRKFGLSGKSFIPMLIASGCGVPAVMATKAIESERDRRMTIMTTTMIPCGAKLPIIALVFGAIAGADYETTWWVAPLFYFLGLFAIIVSCIMLKKTKMFAGETMPFVMELPQYHLPTVKSILLATWERVRSYIVKAGTIIFLSSAVIWFLSSFGMVDGQFGLLDTEMEDYLQYSLIAGLGNLLAWIFVPLGFGDWQTAVASVTGLVAKENVVATVGVMTSLVDSGETDPSLWAAFAGMFTAGTPAIMAFCAFNLLCAPCFAAIGTIRRQMVSAKWTWFAIGYLCAFAWVVALMIFQLGGLAAGVVEFNVWTVVAIALLAGILFQVFRPMPKHEPKGSKAALEGSAA